jgi:hypothetical protein
MNRLYFIVISLGFLILSCSKSSEEKGETLAKKNCGSCHQFPSPDLLSKSEWIKVLPNMALRLGVKSIYNSLDSVNTFEEEVFSKNQVITDQEWEKIQDYFLSNAPEILDNSSKISLKLLRNRFDVKIPQTLSQEVPNITAIKIDPKRNQIYATDEINKQIYFLDKNAHITANFKGLPAISDMQLVKEGLFVTYIGRDIRLTKQMNGYNEIVNIEGTKIKNTQVVLKNLYRPTHSEFHNLDSKGENEIVTCEYGVNKGKFAIWKMESNKYKPILEENRPGAVSSQVIDLNKDGNLDVVVLFAQGDEQLVWYKNVGGLKFERKLLLRFPPVYGSNHFEIVDIDRDGALEILYSCGDNADYSITQKPYHGVYVFKDKGNQQYQKTNFFPIDGATKALARDFDKDGDIDIACIAFFSNFSDNSTSNFIYLENNKGNFEAKGLDIQKQGRWLVMDAEDVDGDGDIDIVLGSHPFGETISPHLDEWRNSTGVLLLSNQTN